MNLVIQQRSETPIYEQLYNQIALQILNGQLRANDCLPSIRLVAKELQISVIPVKTAYEMLENNGYMYTIPAKGCFVADIQTQKDLKKQNLISKSLDNVINYCKLLGISFDEIVDMIKEKYNS